MDAAMHDHLSQRYWDWRELYALSRDAAPMQHPDYVLSESRHAAHRRMGSVLIVTERDGKCAGVAPLIPKVLSTRRVGSLLLNQKVVGLRLAGNDFLLAEPDPDVTSALYAAVLAHVRAVGARFLLMEDLDDRTASAHAVATETPTGWDSFRHAGVQPRRRIELPERSEEYWARFSKKTLQGFRRKLKKFGETRLEHVTDVADVPRFVETAHLISLQTWQTRQFGLRIRNDEETLDLLTILAREGLLRCYLWYTNGEPVAFIVGHQDKGCFHYEEVGYATPYARYSPGQMMLVQMIDDLLKWNRPHWFDFGGGDADYKQLFSNHASRSGTLWLWAPGWKNKLTLGYLRGCRGLRQAGRTAVVTLGMANQARQWVRYGWNRLIRAKTTAVTPKSNDDE